MRDCVVSLRWLVPVVSALMLGNGAVVSADEPGATLPVLHLSGGESVTGELKDTDRPDILRWQSPSFTDPFEFFVNRVSSIEWPAPANRIAPKGDYCFTLAGGDLIFGSLVDLNENEAVLDVAPIGRIHVLRSALQRIDRRRQSADLVYWGPNGLADWHESAPNGWREDGGVIETKKPGAMIFGDLGLPGQAAIEVEISWTNRPDFVLAIGVDAQEAVGKSGFRLEVWDGELVAVRETEREADVAPAQRLSSLAGRVALEATFRQPGQRPMPTEAPEPGRLHALILLDQERGRMSVFTPDGKLLAEVEQPSPTPRPRTGLALTNLRNDLRLERLRIARWNGSRPVEVPANTPRVQRDDGTILSGDVTRFDPASGEFILRSEGKESRLNADRISGIVLSHSDDVRHREVRVVTQDGIRLSGSVLKVEHGEVWMEVKAVQEPLRLPVSVLRSLVALQPGRESIPHARGERTGRLEVDGARLAGRLVDGGSQPGAGCLHWQPSASASASPLRTGVSGRIVYKEPPPQPRIPQTRQTMLAPNVVIVNGVARVVARSINAPQIPAQPAKRLALHLRTGDVIPSEVTRIDEAGVTFKSSFSEKTFVSHDQVMAVELAPDTAVSVRLTKAKRERLLTLPRMQKDSPPTQLIRSRTGDYLRGRVVSMDEKTLQVEVHLETKEVPRDRVSRIIWLQADERGPSRGLAGPVEGERGTRVQAVCSDGIRLTFSAERLVDATLLGTGEVLGTCRVRLAEVDQLLIGGDIEKAAAQLAYQQWKLKNAPEPRESPAEGDSPDGGRDLGLDSPLVGKPAPDFTLDLITGKPFHLAESKGNVVVLDFWATWCGPCMQAMPQVERVAEEFKERGVQFFAVNLQETAEQINATLERHKLHPTVVLDREGTIAEKYKANAIPQTVIIDREGKIVRLFVGAGPHFDDQLREALQALVPALDKK
jgi:thiol-disulfide isomerase/thioredoxin